jgi:hypothetical protein
VTAEPLTAARLFERWFAPYYPPDALADLAAARATDANPGGNPSILAQIGEAAEAFARLAPAAFGAPVHARGLRGDEPRDAPEAPDLALDGSDASVHRLGAALTRERRDRWLERTGAGEPPPLVNIATHGALYVGQCVVRNHGGRWQVRRPLWESLVRLESRAGTGDLAIFHWWLKALSDDEIDKGRLADRYRTHVEVPTFDAERLPVIAPPDRRLPRLAKVRYDTLYKHLRAHLPELRSVGDDFPSPERIEEMGFRWLDFLLLGGGRMLLVHGPGAQGVHLFWLDAAGFAQAAFYPADRFPEHVVQADGDRLRVVVPIGGKTQVHEMLWWGA